LPTLKHLPREFFFILCLILLGCDAKPPGTELAPESRADSHILAEAPVSDRAALYVVLAATDTFQNSGVRRKFAAEQNTGIQAEALADFLLRQESGSLYSKVLIRKLYNENFTKAEFSRALENLESEISSNDALILHISAYSGIDRKGELFIIPWDGRYSAGSRNINARDLAAPFAALKTRKALVLIDTKRSGMETKLAKALGGLDECLGGLPLFVLQNQSSSVLIDAFENSGEGERYLIAGYFTQGPYLGQGSAQAQGLRQSQDPLPGQGSFWEFPLLDRWLEPGLLQISALFPGTVTVTGSGRAESFALDSLESAGLRLPQGNYAVTITYRNSFQESRQVELANNSSAAISFSYRPSLGASSFSGRLPSFGVNIGELNPSNYRKIDQNVLSSMGMEQHRVSFLAGEKFYQAGDYNRAITEFNRAIALKNDYADAYTGRGNAYRKKGDALRAIDDYSTALKHADSRAELYNYRGYAYSEHGEPEKAIADFSQAIRLGRDYTDAYINRGHAHYERGSYELAIEDYNQVIRIEPRNAAAWNWRGSAWYRKDGQKALADFSQAITINPGYALAWHNRGNVHFNNGDFAAALADLNQAIKLAPSRAAYISRGHVLQKLGDTTRAEADFAAAERF
jgi:tetratricopeptide (TPR) repeat protein